MPSEFRAGRPLTRHEYARRRDETTKEELAKLKASPAFRAHSQQTFSAQTVAKHAGLIAPAAVVVLIMIASIFMGSGSREEAPLVQAPIEVSVSLPELETCMRARSELQDATVALSARLSRADNELGAMERAGARAVRELGATRKAAAKQAAAAVEQQETPVAQCQAPSAAEPTATTALDLIAPAAAQFSLSDTQIMLPAGLGAALAVASIAAVVFVRRAAALRRECEALAAELREAVFEKETAEQSVAILEVELQRKIKQLEEAKRMQAQSTTPGSPKIRAGRASSAVTSPAPMRSTTPMRGPSPGSASIGGGTPELPPPPRQLVERFLQERGAIAVETEQVQVWLEMEGEMGRLQREAAALRSLVENRDADAKSQGQELHAHLQELTVALEAHREHARKAKEALRAVRAVGGRGRNSGASSSSIRPSL